MVSVNDYKSLVDLVLFNVCWIANAFGVLYRVPYLGPAVVVLAVVIHLAQVTSTRYELQFLVLTASSGYLWDSLIYNFGFLGFSVPVFTLAAPLWLFSQWFAFALLFRYTLRWLRGRFVLGGILGAFGGPLSYYAAVRMNVLTLGEPYWLSLIVLGTGWSLIVPAFSYVSGRYEHVPKITH